MSDFQYLKRVIDTVTELGVSGIDCVVYRDHKEIFRHAAGYSDIENKTPMLPRALYNIYSGTKMITCAAAMQLVERGRMCLFDPISQYLPEFETMLVKTGTFIITPAQRKIRVVDLFAMTAGISYDRDTPQLRKLASETGGDFGTRDFARALAKEPLLFEPGERWNYSFCHDILGAVIEVVSGMSFGAYLKANIFDPLGMRDSGFSVPEEKKSRIAPQYAYDAETRSSKRIGSECLGALGLRHESGGGGLITCPEDYILFADALACGGVGQNGEKIISQSAIDLMRRNQLNDVCLGDFKKMVPTNGMGYGLGVAVVMDRAQACNKLAPEGAFNWGGIGGVQAFIDPSNRLSYFVAQHTFASPKFLIEPKMINALYGGL